MHKVKMTYSFHLQPFDSFAEVHSRPLLFFLSKIFYFIFISTNILIWHLPVTKPKTSGQQMGAETIGKLPACRSQ